MSAQDTERAAALERRYRRLLRCYPPGHRQVHREEMLGVLLAASTSSLLDISVLTIAVAVVVTHVHDTVDRRVAALIAPVLLIDAASIPFEFEGISTATVVLSLASLLFAVLVWPVAIASWRARVRRASHALPT